MLLCFVEELGGKGDGERLLLPLDDVEEADDIFSTFMLLDGSKFILFVSWASKFGINDVEVAEVTTTDDDVLEGLVEVLAGCKITNVGPELDDDCVLDKLWPRA